MLPLIPALLLLLLSGPANCERLANQGRLQDAVHRLSVADSDNKGVISDDGGTDRLLQTIRAAQNSPHFSAVLFKLIGAVTNAPEDAPQNDASGSLAVLPSDGPPFGVPDWILHCERPRDGPFN
jgi:hypothetical protein